MQLAPPRLLEGMADIALAKMNEFGGIELPALLCALATLGYSNERLVASACARLPSLLGEMNPRSLAEFSAALAASGLWLPGTLEALGAEAGAKADTFKPVDAVAMFVALGELRWDQTAASEPLALKIAALSRRLRGGAAAK